MRLIDARKLKSAIWGITELSYQQKVIVEAHIDGEPTANEWIPVTERLPANGDDVVVCVNGKHKNITFENAIELAAYYTDEGWVLEAYPDWETPEVTAWMPLPEPYEGRENND